MPDDIQAKPKNKTFNWSGGVICSNCKRFVLFDFVRAETQGEGISFPNGDFTAVTVECPYCDAVDTYPSNKWTSRESTDDNVKKVKQLEEEVSRLKAEVEERKKENVRLVENNNNLTEANKIFAHALQDYLTETEKETDKN